MKTILIVFALVTSTSVFAAGKKSAHKRDAASSAKPELVVSQEAIIAAVGAEEVADRLGLQDHIVSVATGKNGQIEITGSNGCKFNVEVHVAMSRTDETKVKSVGPCQ